MSDMLSVLRGGSWYFTAEVCRSAYRFRDYPSYRSFNFGFRVVKETKPNYRMFCGGSWYSSAERCHRSAIRIRSIPSNRDDYSGFRVVKGETNE